MYGPVSTGKTITHRHPQGGGYTATPVVRHTQLLSYGRPSVAVHLDHDPPVVMRGILDTGASQTAICYELAERFDLPIVGAVLVGGVNARPEVAPLYEVRMRLHTLPLFTVQVIGLQSVCHYDILIGRDIIQRLNLTFGPGYFRASPVSARSSTTPTHSELRTAT